MGAIADYYVLVPFYARLDYLHDALVSVVGQTDPHWRVVVVDDSPAGDGLAAAVVELVSGLDDRRISVQRNPTNLGIAGAFNRCFEIAAQRGAELAMILHADDILEPDYVATVRAAHASSPDATCVATRVTVIGPTGAPARTVPDTIKAWLWPNRLTRLSGERGLQLLLRGQFFYCPGVSYRLGELVQPAWNPRLTQAMDLELYGRILLRGGSIVLERRRVFRYRRHAQSMTQLNSVTMHRTIEENHVCAALAAAARRIGWHRAARAGQLRISVRLQSLMRAAQLVSRFRLADAARALMLSLDR